MAMEFSESGVLEPVVWSLTDPIFREALMSGRLGNTREVPNPREAVAVAGRLKAEYTVIVSGQRQTDGFKGRAELFRGTRSIWKDEQNLSVTFENASDTDNSMRSLARTLVFRMLSEPLKGLPTRPRFDTPNHSPGQAPVTQTVQPAPTSKKNNDTLIAQADELMRSGRTSSGVLLLRDAVDGDPLDVELRVALVRLLLETDAQAAALEARRGARLIPDSVEMRVWAARAWMKAGRPDEAQTDLNEAVARSQDAPDTRQLLGEVALMQLRPEQAVQHLNSVVEQADSAEVRFLRAFGNAMAASLDGMRADLDAMHEKEPSPASADITRRYYFAAGVLDQALQADSNEIRQLIQRAIVRPQDKVVLDAVASVHRGLRGRAAFAERLGAPEANVGNHQQRVLAYKLMVQTLTDLQAFMGGGADDALNDTRINFGEAIRNGNAAREADAKLRS
jgi:tetratricopeptide (TPR) repeat protein